MYFDRIFYFYNFFPSLLLIKGFPKCLWLPKILPHTFHKIPGIPPSFICYIKSSQSHFSYVSSAKQDKIFLFGMIIDHYHICQKKNTECEYQATRFEWNIPQFVNSCLNCLFKGYGLSGNNVFVRKE